jgi:beta-glucanase (GH16 family)
MVTRKFLLAVAAIGQIALSSLADWQLVWSDEFDGASLKSDWKWESGFGPPFPGWGNKELQYYTGRPENIYVTNGALHIVARREVFDGAGYTSGKVSTRGMVERRYGRFEFRARLPAGQGLWPAFWLFPADPAYGRWAASGEIDVMENRGSNSFRVEGTLQYGGVSPSNTLAGQAFTFPKGESVTNFHVYALEWKTNSIEWFVDGHLYHTRTSWWSSGGPYPAPFDRPFYLIMNLSVGGNYGGPPSTNTVFPAELEVDYVRVFRETNSHNQ